MINVTKLYCDQASDSDALRYGGEQSRARSAGERRPVVVWNITRRCNLRCVHCYSGSECKSYPNELTSEQCRAVIDDLAEFNVPAVLLSGGEPLTRPDLLDIARYGRDKGLRLTLSTNGTLIDERSAKRIVDTGFTYVGISLDGVGEVNDHFRGVIGAFDWAMHAMDRLRGLGQRVGLRMTLTRHNVEQLDAIFDFIEQRQIPRACFYHLAYSGRGRELAGLAAAPAKSADEQPARSMDLSPVEMRRAMDLILARSRDFARRGVQTEILTVGNHADGVYIYRKLTSEDPARAAAARKLLEWNGGGLYSSGVGIGCIDWQGDVHPDQFWMHYSFGNVLSRPFSKIWQDTSDPLMAGLKDKASHLHGRCARCGMLAMCGGSLRGRAEQASGDPWGPDPACYLVDEEIEADPAM